jgi:4-hydroxy-3-polyprenylbenzoate decarboxylase
MTQAAEIGAIILPPVPAMYALPKTVDDIVDHTVGRALDLLGIENTLVKRWGESTDGSAPKRGAKGRGRGSSG